jgi:transposase
MTSEKKVSISEKEYQQLLSYKSEVDILKHQLAQLQRMLFGQKRERFIGPDPDQGVLFELPAEDAAEKETQEVTYTRSKPKKEKKHPLRAPLPSHLPRREEIIKPDNIPENAKKIGESITEILEYEPANIYVRKIIRPKYVVETSDEQTKIAIAPLPPLPIPKGNAGASLVAHIIVSKFVDHLPWFRQSKMLKRQNIYIPDSTLGGWGNNATENKLSRIWEVIKARIIETDYLMADETPIPVLTENKPGATHQGYLWVYCDPINKIVIFDYRHSRGREGPKSFLEKFRGYLQTDGYTGYEKLGPPQKITLLACMAHARRKFEQALDNDPKRAKEVLTIIQDLYKVEREVREAQLSYDEIKLYRQEKSAPLLDKLEKYLIEEKPLVLPKSTIGRAINYTLKLWPRLKRYVDDARFHIDNNLIENTIRPVALGRKNYLFAGSHNGARNAAIIYSLLATCKLNNVEPFEWLKQTLEILPGCADDQLHKLIPGQK